MLPDDEAVLPRLEPLFERFYSMKYYKQLQLFIVSYTTSCIKYEIREGPKVRPIPLIYNDMFSNYGPPFRSSFPSSIQNSAKFAMIQSIQRFFRLKLGRFYIFRESELIHSCFCTKNISRKNRVTICSPWPILSDSADFPSHLFHKF